MILDIKKIFKVATACMPAEVIAKDVKGDTSILKAEQQELLHDIFHRHVSSFIDILNETYHAGQQGYENISDNLEFFTTNNYKACLVHARSDSVDLHERQKRGSPRSYHASISMGKGGMIEVSVEQLANKIHGRKLTEGFRRTYYYGDDIGKALETASSIIKHKHTPQHQSVA